MTRVLYSTIGSLRQGVFDMQAIKNDALKPGPLGPLWSNSGPIFKSPSNPHKYWVDPILVHLVHFLSPIYYTISPTNKKIIHLNFCGDIRWTNWTRC